MRRIALTTLAAGTVAALVAGPAAAISSYNSVPAPERTEVGAFVVLYDRDGDGLIDRFRPLCSGTMVDDDTFLTAAHCNVGWFDTDRFFVSLEQDFAGLSAAYDATHPALTDPAGLEDHLEAKADHFLAQGWVVEGDVESDPAFPGNNADSHDIGVVDFADRDVTPADTWAFTPATLPTAGQLSALGSRALDAATWWAVGYGTQEARRGPGGHVHPSGGVRLKAMLDFDALNAAWVRLAMNEARGLGGACYGDSGGPNFVELDGGLLLAATTITGDVPCYATNVAYRLDTASARAFLDDFVALP